MAKRLTAAIALSLALAAQGTDIAAQALSDPMRPPGATAPGATPDASTAGPQLQSVLISPHRRVAVINGQTVAVGGKVGEATLVSVAETAIVLKRGEALETVPLLPGVEKRKSAKTAPVRRGK